MGKKRKRPVAENVQPEPAPKGAASAAKSRAKQEISAVFEASAKKLREEPEAEPASRPPGALETKPEAPAKRKRSDRFDPRRQPDPPVHRWDSESGLPVYKAHLLKLNVFGEYNGAKGGGTRLCPFDCDCCF